jgi:hypothetical protein
MGVPTMPGGPRLHRHDPPAGPPIKTRVRRDGVRSEADTAPTLAAAKRRINLAQAGNHAVTPKNARQADADYTHRGCWDPKDSLLEMLRVIA